MKTNMFNLSDDIVKQKDALKYFALSLTKNNEDSEDLLQETILKALTYSSMYEENTNLKAWLFTIMKNIFINNYRKKVKMKMLFDSSKELYLLNVPESKKEFDPYAQLSYKELISKMDRLEDEYKVPLQMYFEGYKYKEIADSLGLPIGTIKSRIFLGRKQLAGKLEVSLN